VGSVDTGIDSVKQTLQRWLLEDQGDWRFEAFNFPSKSSQHLRTIAASGERRVVLLSIPYFFSPEDIHSWLVESIRLMGQLQKHNQRLVYVLREDLVLEWWLWLYRQGKEDLLDPINVRALQPWSEWALHRALEMEGYLAESERIQGLIEGWHVLIGEVFYRAQKRKSELGDNASLVEVANEVKRDALQGEPLQISDKGFLQWLNSPIMRERLIPFLKWLLAFLPPEEKWTEEERETVKGWYKEEYGDGAELDFEAHWDFLIRMGIIEQQHFPEKYVEFCFNSLAWKRMERMEDFQKTA